MKQKIKIRLFSFLTAMAVMFGSFVGVTPAMAAELDDESAINVTAEETTEYTGKIEKNNNKNAKKRKVYK